MRRGENMETGQVKSVKKSWAARGIVPRAFWGGAFALALVLSLGIAATAQVAPAPVQASDNGGRSLDPNAVQDTGRVYDLYIMSMCPYGIAAINEFVELVRVFPDLVWNVWFVGTAQDDRLSSLRGEEEIFDETLWLAVKALYPFRYNEFLFLRGASQGPTEKILDEMGLNVERIRRWAEDTGRNELRQHYMRSMRLNVNASPTLFINKVRYDNDIGGGRLLRKECRSAKPQPPLCSDYPECFDDADCDEPNKIGTCIKIMVGDVERPACQFRDDATFKLTVLVADNAMDSPETEVVAAVKELMPGAQVEIVTVSSGVGKAVMARFMPDRLPYFHFEKMAEKAYRFADISEMLTPATLPGREPNSIYGFTFRDGVVRTNFFTMRPEKPGTIELYIDPLMPDVGKVLTAVLSDPVLAKRVTIKPLVSPSGQGGDAQIPLQNKLRNEEAVRWMTMSSAFPKNYQAYLKRYATDPASSYWFNWLKPIGVNQKKFLRGVEAERKKLEVYSSGLSEVSLGEPVMLLINNRLKVVISGEQDLERVLGNIRN